MDLDVNNVLIGEVVDSDAAGFIENRAIVPGSKAARRHLYWLEALETFEAEHTANTASAYCTAVCQFWTWLAENGYEAWESTSGLARLWRDYLLLEGNHGEPMKPSSVNQKIAAVRKFYDFVRFDYIFPTPGNPRASLFPGENPFARLRGLKVSKYGRAVFPSREEMVRIFKAIIRASVVGKRDFTLIWTFYTTCRRASEILHLRWGDLEELPDGDFCFWYKCKGGEMKRAVLKRACYDAIIEYLQADGRLDDIQADDYVFGPLSYARERHKRLHPESDLDDNRPLTRTTVNNILRKYGRRAGVDLEKMHIHGLRHAGARLRVQQMREEGRPVDFEELMNLLGHSDISVTQIYVETVLDTPEDPGGDGVVEEVMRARKGARSRAKRN